MGGCRICCKGTKIWTVILWRDNFQKESALLPSSQKSLLQLFVESSECVMQQIRLSWKSGRTS